jgi:hypothetical protein
MNDIITRNELVDLLKMLIGKRCSNTVYIRTDDNHLISIGVEDGAIVSLMAGPRQGERAIATLQNLRSGTYRIEPGVAAQRRGGLPTSDEVLQRISSEGAGGGGDAHWIQNTLCKLLVTYLGPIAPLVCQQTMAAAGPLSSRDKVLNLVESLAREIDVPAEADRFRAQATHELARALG